jgi:hypothetical protein
MALPPAFKTDESFLEKIVMGARATQRTFQDLERQGHEPIELERGSMSFKIWKAIKTKRVRVPDILCLRCGHRCHRAICVRACGAESGGLDRQRPRAVPAREGAPQGI